MAIFRLAQGALLALIVAVAFGYFLWIEVRQLVFFKSTQARVERLEPVCFLSTEGQSSAADCASVRARAGKSKVYQMYRATLRYQSPADDREHVETILTRALGPLWAGTSWKVLAHKSDANRVEPVNEGGRAILFGVSVFLFVVWMRGAVNRYIRRVILNARAPSPKARGTLGPGGRLVGAITFAIIIFFVFRSITPP